MARWNQRRNERSNCRNRWSPVRNSIDRPSHLGETPRLREDNQHQDLSRCHREGPVEHGSPSRPTGLEKTLGDRPEVRTRHGPTSQCGRPGQLHRLGTRQRPEVGVALPKPPHQSSSNQASIPGPHNLCSPCISELDPGERRGPQCWLADRLPAWAEVPGLPSVATVKGVSDEYLRDDWQSPAADRLKKDHPLFDEIIAAHNESREAGQLGYTDPVSGHFVFNARGLAGRGYCCARGCRHCPYDRS